MGLFEQVSADIMAAMKARDKVKLDALRNVKKVFLEARTAPENKGELTDEAALKILQKLAKQGKDTAKVYEANGRAELAQEELAQVAVIESYLPKQLSDDELRAVVSEIIVRTGAQSIKDQKRSGPLSPPILATYPSSVRCLWKYLRIRSIVG